MPQRNSSPPPTPVSSPRASPTPPGSPKPAIDPEQPSQALGLSPSPIPLRPVHAPDASNNIIQVDSAPVLRDGMDIDDATNGPSPSSSPLRYQPGADDNVSGSSDQDWSNEDWMVDMRRVKVYELVGPTWTDRGTALCTGVYDEELDSAAIVAKSEMNELELLRSEIRAQDIYQKQQDTLIVWTGPDGTDFALSFQDMEGCSEIWDFIVEVQRHFRGKSSVDPNSSFSSGFGDTQSRLSVASIIASGRLPEPALGIIAELDSAIKAIAKTVHGRERICEYILNEEYIRALIDVQVQAEDLESLVDLHALHTIMQTILSMNDHGVYDYILGDNIYPGVVGVLEYDPEFPTYKAAYREFLKHSAEHQRSFEFRNPEIQRKIQQTYRLQYLKDVVLARVIDDATFNVLNSFILFNQIDIINHILGDPVFLRDLFQPFVTSQEILRAATITPLGSNTPLINGKQREQAPSPPPSSPTNGLYTPPLLTRNASGSEPSTKSDVMRFLHQLCLMGKNVQIPTRMALYRNLVERGLLFALEWALWQPLPTTTSNSNFPSSTSDDAPDPHLLDMVAEVFIIVVDHNAVGVRQHIVRQNDALKVREQQDAVARSAAGTTNPPALPLPKPYHILLCGEEPNLLRALLNRLGGTREQPFRNQMGDAIRLLLEVPPTIEFHAPPAEKNGQPQGIVKLREDPVNEHFFPVFYENGVVSAFFKPLLSLPEWKDMSDPELRMTREQAALYLYLCDLLCTILVQHSHRSQYFVLSSIVSPRIASLLRTRDKHMRLAALRFFRVCVRMNNQFITRHLIKHDVFSPILTLAVDEALRDNLVSASCQEFFEHIRKENLKPIITHIMEHYEDRIQALSELELVGPRFKALIQRWEQNTAPPPPINDKAVGDEEARKLAFQSVALKWGQGTNLSTEEESYFNGDDDDEENDHELQPIGSVWTSAKESARARKAGLRSAARASPSSPRPASPAGGFSVTPASHSPQASSSGSSSIIIVPQAFPMRSLLDYDDNDDEMIGPMPATEVSTPSPTSSPIIKRRQSADSNRKLQRTESMHPDVNGGLSAAHSTRRSSAAAAASASTSTSTSTVSSPQNFPQREADSLAGLSGTKRTRGGSIIAGTETKLSTPLAATHHETVVPPLKRRRETEDDDDDAFSAMSRTTRRRSTPTPASPSTLPSSPSSTKGKGKEMLIEQLDTADKDASDKPGATKRIRLSLKGALGLKEKEPAGQNVRPPSPSVVAAGGKDGDGG